MLISASPGPPQYKADASAQAGKRCPHQLGYFSILPAVPQGPLSKSPRNDRPLHPTRSTPSMSPTARETRVDRSEPPSRSPRARAPEPLSAIRGPDRPSSSGGLLLNHRTASLAGPFARLAVHVMGAHTAPSDRRMPLLSRPVEGFNPGGRLVPPVTAAW